MENVRHFPAYITKDVIKEIYQWGKENDIDVYRVSKYGKDTTKAFLNYYEETVRGLIVKKNKEQYLKKCTENIDQLSVSCYSNKGDIVDYYLGLTYKVYPEAILLRGTTNSKHGLSSKTKERKPHKQDSHVDWWLYDKATPWDSFMEVKINE